VCRDRDGAVEPKSYINLTRIQQREESRAHRKEGRWRRRARFGPGREVEQLRPSVVEQGARGDPFIGGRGGGREERWRAPTSLPRR
jgi:hypothetical protein